MKIPEPCLAFYSSIPCEPTFGGPLQIYRHFRERDDFDFIDLNPSEDSQWDAWLPRWVVESRVFKRLCNTRLFPWIIYASNHSHLGRQARALARQIREIHADALVTVAYGRRCHVARVAARIAKVPLITFYHDWWPDLVYAKTPQTLARMDKQFRKLAADSELVLSVSQQLLDELGVTERCVVLPPIPADRMASGLCEIPADVRTEKKLVYAGTLEGPYGAMVRDLGMAILAQPDEGWMLRAYGPANDWPGNEKEYLTSNGIYGGTLAQGSELQAALQSADALLVVMDFELNNRRRVKTSFPSKILDYAQIEKPIITWGPEDCFASLFTVKQKLGHCWTQPTVTGLIRDLNMSWSENKQISSTQAVRDLADGSFSADAIHRTLRKAVEKMFDKIEQRHTPNRITV